MANTKTAKKQILVNERNHARNLHYKTRLKNVVKKVRAILGDPKVPADEAKKALIEAQRVINQTSSKGIIHKNTASRKISRLALLLKRTHMPEAVVEQPVEVKPAVEIPVEVVAPVAPVVEETVQEPVTESIEPAVEVAADPEPVNVEPVASEFSEPAGTVEDAEPAFHDEENAEEKPEG